MKTIAALEAAYHKALRTEVRAVDALDANATRAQIERAWALADKTNAALRAVQAARAGQPLPLFRFVVEYVRIPTNYNASQRAIVEAEDEDAARALISERLGDRGLALPNYFIERVTKEEPIMSTGRVVSIGGAP